MSNQVCLLCLQVFDDTVAKSPLKIRLETLHKLVTRCHHNYQSFHEADLDGDEMCDFCADCYPLFSTVEEIRTQISLLEEQVRTQMKQIQKIIGESSSSQLENGGMTDKIVQIRDMIFHATTGANYEKQLGDNFVFLKDEVQVKVEQDLGDEFFYGDFSSSSPAGSVDKTKEEEEMDHLINDQDDDTAFCIIPSSQKKSTGRAKPTNQKLEKRKREDSPTTKKLPQIKQTSKLDSLHRPQATRSSTRVKNSATKTLVVSLKRVDSAVRKSSNKATNPRLSSDDDDDDYVPETENVSIKPSPDKKVRHKNDSIPCLAPSCTATFRTQRAMFAHVNTTHEDIVPYRCKICKRKCGGPSRLAAHMVMRHEKGEKKLPCIKCGKKFCLEENLARHLGLHDVEEIKPLACDVCEERFVSEERLKRHLATHAAKFRCQHCGKKFRCRTGLARHERSHTGERAEKCSLCDAKFHDKVTLQRHVLRDHSSSAQNICHICGKGFHLPVDLKLHLNRHERKYQVKCDTCGETCLTTVQLQAHRVKMHGEDPVVCDECGNSFTSTSGLLKHKKIHTGVKNHKCETCGACFQRPGVLKNHIRTHTGERPFPCPHCEKAFKTRTCMNIHVKVIHTPGYVVPTPHKCSHCDKAFPCRSLLQGHIRKAHTGERPFICDHDQCGARFAVKSALDLHLRTVHGVILKKRDMLPRSKKDAFHGEEERD